MNNPLLGSNRERIFSAAIAVAGRGARIIDDGAHLTLWEKNRTTCVGVSVSNPRNPRLPRCVRVVRVNVDTFETTIED